MRSTLSRNIYEQRQSVLWQASKWPKMISWPCKVRERILPKLTFESHTNVDKTLISIVSSIPSLTSLQSTKPCDPGHSWQRVFPVSCPTCRSILFHLPITLSITRPPIYYAASRCDCRVYWQRYLHYLSLTQFPLVDSSLWLFLRSVL